MGKGGLAGHSKKGALEKRRLGFLDESGISERPTVRRTWALRGKTPVIASTGSWSVRTVVGVITCTPKGDEPKLYIRIFNGSIHKEETVRFLKELKNHVRTDLLLIWDRLAAHRSKIVQEYVASHSWLKTEHFPPYAPELNPVEYVWATAKNHDLANIYPEGLKQLDDHIRRMKRRLRRRVDILKGFLKKSSLFG